MSTSSHVAPPKVTIASRPQTAAAAATGGVTAHMSGSEVPVPVLLTTPPQQPFENGRRNNPSKKLPTPVLVSTHVNSSLFATPTRPPPPSVRPKSSSVSATTAIKRSVPATPAQSAIASPRSRASLSAERAQESSFKRASATPALSSSAADTTGNIYHAMVARKSAEDTATQLARRIAHFRAQEERVLREVQDVKSKLESALLAAHQQQTSASAQHQGGLWPAISSPQRRSLQSWTENSGGRCASNTQSRREPKAPRNREQLQFLTKQKKVFQMRKVESAKHQKEKRKLALEKQKLKEEADKHGKVVQKEKIRQEYRCALHQRVTKQHQLLESFEEQHEERLQSEREREHRALDLIEQLREEEKYVVLRLQALKFHQEFIKRGLSGE